MTDSDAPALEAQFLRLREAVEAQLRHFGPVNALLELWQGEQQRARRAKTLEAIGEAAVALAAGDERLRGRLLKVVSHGERFAAEDLLTGTVQNRGSAARRSHSVGATRAGVPTDVDAGSVPVASKTATTRPTPAETEDDPAHWSPEKFRQRLRSLNPRNRTELRRQHGAIYRALQRHYPELLDELLPSQRGVAASKAVEKSPK